MSVYTEIKNTQHLSQILQENTNIVVIKFGAEWCNPCKYIAPHVQQWIEKFPQSAKFYIIDVDDNFEIYAFFKSKKMLKGIPVLFCYHKGNTHFVPDDIVIGADKAEIDQFFIRSMDALHKP